MQLDARGQALGGQAGLRPRQERGADRRRAGAADRSPAPARPARRCDRSPQGRSAASGARPAAGSTLQARSGIRSAAVARERSIDQRRIEHERGQRDRQERQDQPGRLRTAPAPSAHSGSRPTPPPRQTPITASEGNGGARSAITVGRRESPPVAAMPRRRDPPARPVLGKTPRRPGQAKQQDRDGDHRGIQRDETDHDRAGESDPSDRARSEECRPASATRACAGSTVPDDQRGHAHAGRKLRRQEQRGREGRVTTTTPMPGRWADRQRSKLDTASTRGRRPVPVRKKSSGEASHSRDQRREPRAATAAMPDPPDAPRSTTRRAQPGAAAAMPTVSPAAPANTRVARRQSSSGPVAATATAPREVSSAASSRSRIRARARRGPRPAPHRDERLVRWRANDERAGFGFGPPSNCRRKATGTMLVSRENSVPAAAVPVTATGPPPPPRRCGGWVGGIEYRLDADQLQALRALRQEIDAGPVRRSSGTSSERPVQATGWFVAP